MQNNLPLPTGYLNGFLHAVGQPWRTSLSPGSSHMACAQPPQPPSPTVMLRGGEVLVPHSQSLAGIWDSWAGQRGYQGSFRAHTTR